MEAASRFLARLTPADRVGLIAFPGSGPSIDFTSNHAVVQSALPGLTGLTDTFPSSYRIGTSEAMAIVQGDRTALNVVVQRECASAISPEERDLCMRQVMTDANGIYSGVTERTQTALTTLRSIVERLSQTTTPKTIVYISEGLVLERPGDGTWLGPAAARGQVTIYALQLEVFGSDASTAREPVTPGRDKALALEGLGVIAGSTRGTVPPGRGQRRQRLRATGSRVVRLLPPELRARVRRSGRQAAQDQGGRAGPLGRGDPRPKPVLHRRRRRTEPRTQS